MLGIDTGGTYTDGVLLEYGSRQVLATHKSLTTKRDFSLGIEAVIKGIRIQDPAAIKMVAISTTLATNAIAEGKGKRVALLLVGYDPELIQKFKLARRFATPHYFYFAGGHDLYGREKEPLDLDGILARVAELKGQVDAFAVSSYFSPLNPDHENQIYEAIIQACDLPVVLGHQLSTKLGSVERATTAALNASLLAALHDFIVAVRQALARRQIQAPLMVVRGDGTLMSADFAARSPVETIHSGPAASAIGGRFLARQDDALVIDIGGTTTDIALVEAGQVAVSETGALVGDYQTAVKAASLLSIGLGGDSHIDLDRRQALRIGPQRVVPLALLAQQYPAVQAQLKNLLPQFGAQDRSDWLEYWFLLREPQDGRRIQTIRHKELLALLRQGPQPVPRILERLGIMHVSQLSAGELLRQEIIGRAGLTPTDLLHAEGRWTLWDREAAVLAERFFCRFLGQEPAELRRLVWDQMTETIVQAIITFLTGLALEPPKSLSRPEIGWWFFQNSLARNHAHLATTIRLSLPIIGIGAPADVFLPAVAEKLDTELFLPDHYPVANAVGAVAGSVMVVEEILVYPQLSSQGLEVIGFYVQAGNHRERYSQEAEALGRARGLGQERALAAAAEAGAVNPQVLVEELAEGLDTYRVRIRALGNPRL